MEKTIEEFKCGYCRGTGRIFLTESEACPTCLGSGKNTFLIGAYFRDRLEDALSGDATIKAVREGRVRIQTNEMDIRSYVKINADGEFLVVINDKAELTSSPLEAINKLLS